MKGPIARIQRYVSILAERRGRGVERRGMPAASPAMKAP